MAMKPYKRAVAQTGSYTDRQGNEKKRYVNVGTLFQYDDGGFALKLDSVPVGEGWSGFISFYDLDDKREGAGNQSRGGTAGGGPREAFADDDPDSQIPFVSAEGIR